MLKFQHRFVGGQKQTVAGAARQELDLRSGLTLVRLEEQRQRQRRRKRLGAMAPYGTAGFADAAGFGGIHSGCKIKRDACGGEHGRAPETQPSSHFRALFF